MASRPDLPDDSVAQVVQKGFTLRGRLLRPASVKDFSWRAALLAGMLTGPLVVRAAFGAMPPVQVPVSTPALLIGGLLVGIGVTLASGCTSGHGVCGIARLSRRSVVATLTFMAAGAATVALLRHVWGVI